MSTHKTKIEQQAVVSFLETHFKESIQDFIFIEGGESSQAFSFSVKNNEYIIRVNTQKHSFEKDQYAHDHFKSEHVPIPKIIEIGLLDDKFFYAISYKIAGKKVDAFPEEESSVIQSRLFGVLDSIHAINISSTQGYGQWDESGQAKYASWRDYLKSLKKWTEPQDGKLSLFENSILEKDVYDNVDQEILKLIECCPEERYLVHGDYGFDNVFSDGKNITGVIDWGESKYGDFIYDAAWLSYWSKEHKYREIVKNYYADKKLNLPNFEERMRCYELHIGLGALSFYASSQQDKKYHWNKERLLSLL